MEDMMGDEDEEGSNTRSKEDEGLQRREEGKGM
eukprot:CAMPEP_0174740492 /NCGR_PEP_ID=MMETSP1094-20130205/73713_1 /TAXON_ID=156173 /ORGANISM="Chrysochromulina brevifilum, Strain UTEX LB 985" /LENGTH=32 /DNA_ID= /DNA_START= /DNA_END= /DNA_ORIENTATION=